MMVLFFFCNFFGGFSMLQGLNRSLCGDINSAILSESDLGSHGTRHDGAEAPEGAISTKQNTCLY